MSSRLRLRPSGALRHRRFAAFFLVASISNAAAWMQIVAVPALLFDLTGRATWLGVASMASLVPAVLLTPYAGVFSDRHDRRRILLVTQTALMVSAFSLLVLVASGHVTPWWIVGIGAASGVATGFQTTAWQAFVPSLVPSADVVDAVRLNSVQFTVARAVGPAAAGVVLTAFGTAAAIFLNAATFMLVIAVLTMIRSRPPAEPGGRRETLHALRNGTRYVWHNPRLRLATTLSVITASTGQSLQYVSPAVASYFGRDSTDNAGLLTALGLGALLASAISRWVLRNLDRHVVIGLAMLCFGAQPLLIAASRDYRLGLAGYAIGGVGHLTTAVSLNTLIQSETSEEFRGRALSFYVVGVLAGIPLGALAIGALGDLVGMRAVLAVDGAIVLVVLGALVAGRRLVVMSSADRHQQAGVAIS